MTRAAFLKVQRWNENHPIGTAVHFWAYMRIGEPRVGRTRSPAHVLAGRPVVWIDGWAGPVALTHVRPVVERQLTLAGVQ